MKMKINVRLNTPRKSLTIDVNDALDEREIELAAEGAAFDLIGRQEDVFARTQWAYEFVT